LFKRRKAKNSMNRKWYVEAAAEAEDDGADY
jgi:hypothetical protein